MATNSPLFLFGKRLDNYKNVQKIRQPRKEFYKNNQSTPWRRLIYNI